jgi:hypothetical protein
MKKNEHSPELSDSPAGNTHFSPSQLDRALPLYESVQQYRWETSAMSEEEEQTICRLWVCQACALLEERLSAPDRSACLWVKRVVKAIAWGRFYVHGLSRDHQGDWRLLIRDFTRHLRSIQHRLERSEPHRQSCVIKVASPQSAGGPSFPRLAGRTVLIVGGEADDAVLDHLQEASFDLDWVPDNIRRIQSAVERIRRGRVDGVVFLTDLNGHVTFAMVRNACRFRNTPMVMGTKGVAGVVRALEQLDEQLIKASA